jgi:hypothetical protein
MVHILVGSIVTDALAQVDPTKALIGTWEGTLAVSGANTSRILIINSVKAKGAGEWVARGRFGIPDMVSKEPGGQVMDVSLKDNEIFVEFVTGGKVPVRLKLVGDNKLAGTANIILSGGRAADRTLMLEKVEPKAGDVK